VRRPRAAPGARAAAAALCALLLRAAPAAANMADPWSPGAPVGEPSGPLGAIAVVDEALALDLRPFATHGTARIAATYHLRNDGPAADLDLLFVSPGLATASVTVDGAAVAVTPVADAPLPPEWRAPENVPSVAGGERTLDPAGRGARATGSAPHAFRFRAALAPGPHTVAVLYDALPGEYHGHHYYCEYQLGYVLAPARAWGSFGKLAVTIDLPPAWEAAVSLPLARTGDRLAGTFDGVPADALGLSVRHPLDALPHGVAFGLSLAAGLVAALGAGGAAEAQSRRRRGGRVAVVLRLLVVVLVGAAALAGALLAGESLWFASLDASQISRTWSYGAMIEAFLLGVGALLGGGATGLLGMLFFRLVRGRPTARTGG